MAITTHNFIGQTVHKTWKYIFCFSVLVLEVRVQEEKISQIAIFKVDWCTVAFILLFYLMLSGNRLEN